MTPREVTNALIDLGIIYIAKPKNPYGAMGSFLNMLGPEQQDKDEDFGALGYNSEDGLPPSTNEPVDDTLNVITDPSELRKIDAWFLGISPPKVFPNKIAGQVMSIAVRDRKLLVRAEEIPWGLDACLISICCEYITKLEVRNNTLLISSKVGNVALQIHEITTDQCKI